MVKEIRSVISCIIPIQEVSYQAPSPSQMRHSQAWQPKRQACGARHGFRSPEYPRQRQYHRHQLMIRKGHRMRTRVIRHARKA